MPPTKSVTIGVSVSAAAALVALIVALIVFFTRRNKPAPAPQPGPPAPTVQCGDPPTVAPDGVVTNYTHTAMPDNTCGENVATLNQLCLQTLCTSRDAGCNEYATWDAYDKGSHKCYKASDPTCEQQLCDSTPCLAPSVRQVLPPFHKITTSAGCVNPGDSEVGAACNALTDFQFVYPNCVPSTAEPVIELIPQTSTPSALKGMLNVNVEGAAGTENLVFTYTLQGPTGILSGPALALPPSDGSLCKQGMKCASYNIYLQPPIRAGTYTLKLDARPDWSPVVTYTTVAPQTIQVVAPPPQPNVFSALNASPSQSTAVSLVDGSGGDALLRTLLSEIPQHRATLTMTIPSTLKASDLLWLKGSVGDVMYSAACKPDMCPLEGGSVKLMPYALIVVAWPPVQPLSTSSAGCAGPVEYEVTRQDETSGSRVDIVLPRTARPAFADAVRVGAVVTYTITTYQGTCKSEPVTVLVNVPAFKDGEVCSKVTLPPPFDLSLPGWMWSSPSGCQWINNYFPAQDTYCMFNNGTSGLDVSNVTVADFNNKCQKVLPSMTTLTHPFAGAYCDENATLKEACFDGLDTGVKREAFCSLELPLGNSGQSLNNVSTLVNRVDKLHTFVSDHPELYPNVSIVDLATLRDEVSGYYNRCGPSTAPTTWGVDAAQCPAYDQACLDAAMNARCGGSDPLLDRNICDAWTPKPGGNNEYEQGRLCFVSAGVGASQCCAPGETYEFDNTLSRGSARGSCKKT